MYDVILLYGMRLLATRKWILKFIIMSRVSGRSTFQSVPPPLSAVPTALPSHRLAPTSRVHAKTTRETRMWADAQLDGRPAEYRWRPCEISVIPFLVWRRKLSLTPTARVPWSNATNIGERKSWTQSEFCTWQNSLRGKSPGKCIYSLSAQETAERRAKFGWLPLSDVAAVTKPRPETRWNLLRCPKLTNRSQPLVG